MRHNSSIAGGIIVTPCPVWSDARVRYRYDNAVCTDSFFLKVNYRYCIYFVSIVISIVSVVISTITVFLIFVIDVK